MKLTLLILLLIGVVSATQDLSGSEAAQDPVRIEDATEKEAPSLRALGSRQQYCDYDFECRGGDPCWKCNRDGLCVRRNKCRVRDGKYNYYDGYRGVFRDIGKYCTRNRQCRGDLLRCNKSRDRCELKRDFEYGSNRLFKYCKHNSQCHDSDLKCNKSMRMCVPKSGYNWRYFDRCNCGRNKRCNSRGRCVTKRSYRRRRSRRRSRSRSRSGRSCNSRNPCGSRYRCKKGRCVRE